MKVFNGKAIYQPKGKAAEYSGWACNFYVGCSNGCTYCYCKKGILSGAMGQDKPQLKKCFKNERHAIEVFEKELKANLPELQKHGLFFSFTTDPFLEKTIKLTSGAVYMCLAHNIPVKVLTKCSDWIYGYKCGDDFIYFPIEIPQEKRNMVTFGFTLTGHDELEPNASPNAERIKAMRKLHEAGFKTFASIEPVIDFYKSRSMIEETQLFCDLYKIGLMSGKKYDKIALQDFIFDTFGYVIGMNGIFYYNSYLTGRRGNLEKEIKVYFKDSLLKAAGISREYLPDNCVGRDFNMFND